jgi:hypothetical protein
MTNLYRLVYCSRNLIAGSSGDTDHAVQDILSVARRRNAQLGITGALMFNSGCFLQTLEGTRDPLMDLFAHIKRDKRHDEVSMLSCEPITERAFGNWSMAYVGTNERDLARHQSIAKETGYDPSRMSGDAVFEFLHRLVLEGEPETASSF